MIWCINFVVYMNGVSPKKHPITWVLITRKIVRYVNEITLHTNGAQAQVEVNETRQAGVNLTSFVLTRRWQTPISSSSSSSQAARCGFKSHIIGRSAAVQSREVLTVARPTLAIRATNRLDAEVGAELSGRAISRWEMVASYLSASLMHRQRDIEHR